MLAVRVLAVDTTTAHGSVALAEDGELVGEVRFRVADTHSAHLVPAIEFLLGQTGCAPDRMDGYAVTTGPGSFTGLRVGISTVQGLALASGRRCIGMAALDVLATRARGAAATIVAMIDAYRGEVYVGVYDGQARPTGPHRIGVPREVLAGVPASAAFVGDGALNHRESILAARPSALFPERSLYLAGTLAVLASPRLAAGEGSPPEGLRPLYIRAPDVRPPSGNPR
jgi:tRNA threonylcarbamoyladenosine biosynthesis protein TsaB